MSTETNQPQDQSRPLGFYWVRVGHEWQVARYHHAGWFLTGVSAPAPDDFIDQIGEPVMDNGTIQVVMHYYRRTRRLSVAALVASAVSIAFSLLNYSRNL